MKFLDNVGEPFILSNILVRLSMSRKDTRHCVEVIEKTNKCKSFLAPIFSWGMTQLFYGRLLVQFTICRMIVYSSLVMFANLSLRTLALT